MHFEVEQKYPVADLNPVRQRLFRLGAQMGETILQVDCYFAHPCRDFAATDEALRIRQVGRQNCLTFKGPKIDPSTKSRREIELPVGEGPEQAAAWEQLLQALGFVPAARVRKRRQPCTLNWRDAVVEIALDDVDGVGTFVELERSADERTLDAARSCILSLARQLELSGAERRSYLELLLSAPGGPPQDAPKQQV